MIAADHRAKGIAAMLHTSKAMHWVHPADSRYYYYQQMCSLVQMALDHQVPVPWEETLAILQTLDAAEKLATRPLV